MHTFAMSSSKSSNLRSSGRSYIFLIFVAGYPLDSEYFRTNLGESPGVWEVIAARLSYSDIGIYIAMNPLCLYCLTLSGDHSVGSSNNPNPTTGAAFCPVPLTIKRSLTL